MKLLVTGGTGFIGRAVAKLAFGRGWEPVLLAPEAPGELGGELFESDVVVGDIVDSEALTHQIEEVAPDAVVHLAAYAASDSGLLRSAALNPQRAVAVNVSGFLNVIQAARAVGCRRITWSSSTTVYGPASRYQDEVDEDSPAWPQTVYGTTKLASELLSVQAAPDAMSIVGLRLPLVYGPGRWYGGALGKTMTFVGDVAAGRPARLKVNEQPIDWMYVDDAAAALLAPLEIETCRSVYNVVGHRASLGEFGREVARHATALTEVAPGVSDPNPYPLIDGRRAIDELGFRAEIGLPEGVDRWIDAERDRLVEERPH